MNDIGMIQRGIQLYLREIFAYTVLVQIACTVIIVTAVMIFRGRE